MKMSVKRCISLILGVALLMGILGTFTACKEHEHAWGDWQEWLQPDCTNYGELKRVCKKCDAYEIRKTTKHIYADGECPICGAKQMYSRVNSLGDIDAAGEYVLFGSYPQVEVTDEALVASLNQRAGTLPGTRESYQWVDYRYRLSNKSYAFMWYQDVEYEGELYRGVYFTNWKPTAKGSGENVLTSSQHKNGYKKGNVYWFRFEPIKWRILEEADGKAFLLSDMIIDNQYLADISEGDVKVIDGRPIYDNNYEYSRIREWLNASFRTLAFTEAEQSIINLTLVDNNPYDVSLEENPYICDDTQDYIFYLSKEDLNKSAYGMDGTPETIRKSPTDYAQIEGCTTWETEYGFWNLRTPSSQFSNILGCVSPNGGVQKMNVTDYVGVVPAMWITLVE